MAGAVIGALLPAGVVPYDREHAQPFDPGVGCRRADS